MALESADLNRLASLAAGCVHCGFCLPACPTYAITRDENDSPRGRILLLAGVARSGSVEASVRRHIDRCIGCEACVPACPSGVRYDEMLAIARRVVNQDRPLFDRLWRAALLKLLPYPERTRATKRLATVFSSGLAVGLLGRMGPFGARLAAMMLQGKAAASLGRAAPSGELSGSAAGEMRGRVALVGGCVAAAYLPGVTQDAAYVLEQEGISVSLPEGQGCCGALSAHAGDVEQARRFARKMIDVFGSGEFDAVLVTAAGCGAEMKRYPELLEDDPDYDERAKDLAQRVKDISEYLAALEPVAPRGRLGAKVAYHEACHLAWAQGVRAEPRALLKGIPGVEMVESGGLGCCGSGGLFALEEVGLAGDIGARKRDAVVKTGASIVVSGNPGCSIQLARVLDGVEVLHPVSLLARSIAEGRSS